MEVGGVDVKQATISACIAFMVFFILGLALKQIIHKNVL